MFYSWGGQKWGHSDISVSLVPDGTSDGSNQSNLFAMLDAIAPRDVWQREIARAMQTWANVSKLNFRLVSDDGSNLGTFGVPQGDSRFGDIRIDGHPLSGYVGYTNYPLPLGTAGGDMTLNPNYTFGIGSGVDLYSVVLHELGHALGLGHSGSGSVMYSSLQGVYTGLAADDIAGIQAIYGARQHDAFDLAASNNSSGTASVISTLAAPGAASFAADLTTMADVDYYRWTVPTGTSGTLTVSMDARGKSLLAPKLLIYDSNNSLVGSADVGSAYGTVATVTISGLQAGQVYTIMADGATADVFGMGAYRLDMEFSTSTAVNAAPVNTVPSTQTMNEGQSLVFSQAAGNRISISDVDAGGNPVRVTLTAANGAMTLASTAGLTFSAGDGAADGTMTFTGTMSSINAALNGMSFTPTGGFTGAASVQITTNDLGNTGSGGAKSDTDTVSITVNAGPQNAAPVNTVPGGQTVAEDTTLVFSSGNGNQISISDADAGSGQVHVTLSVTGGTVTLAQETGLTILVGGSPLGHGFAIDGDHDHDEGVQHGCCCGDCLGAALASGNLLVFTGTLASINAALNGLVFTPTANFAGAASITITTNDQGNTGTGGAKSDADTVSVTVSAVNDAPVNTVPGSQTVAEDATLVFSAANGNQISVADVDAGASPVRVTLSATNGALTLSTVSGLAFSAGDGTADTTMTFTGTLASVNAALNGLAFAPNADFNGAASIQLTTSDLGGTGSGGAKTDADTVSITVSAVNDAPVNTVPPAQSVAENTPLVFSTANGNRIAVSDVDAGNVQVTLSVNSGALTLATTSGLAFSAGDGASDAAMTFSGTQAAVNAALDGLRFNPANGYSGAVTLQISTNDLGNTGSGGAKSDVDSVTINVDSINDAPVNTVPGSQTVAEDATLVFSAANGNLISIADVDAGTSPVRVTLSATNGALTLSTVSGLTFSAGDGAADGTMTFTGTLASVNAALNGLAFAPTANFAGAASVTITTNDLGNTGTGGAKSDADTVSVTVSAVNDAPVNTVPGSQTVAEDATLVFSSGNGNQISVADVDATGNVQVTLSATNGRVTLSTVSGLAFSAGDGTADTTMTFTGTLASVNAALNGLAFAPNANFNGAASIQITTSDLGGTGSGGAKSDTDTVGITVSAVNDAPVHTVPGGQQVTQGGVLTLSSANGNQVSVSDLDAGAGQVEVALGVNVGTLTLGSLSGLTFSSGDGTAEGFMTFRGSLASVNAALNGLKYTPAPGFVGTATFTVSTSDLGNTGSGGAKTDADSFSISVGAAPGGTRVVDNGDPDYWETGGGWGGMSSGFSLGYQDDARWRSRGGGNATANWQFTGLASGQYEVYTTWYVGNGFASNAPFSIYDGQTLEQTTLVNLMNAPSGDLYDGKAWQSLGTVAIENGALVVSLSDKADNWIIADAVRIVPRNAPPTVAAIADQTMSHGVNSIAVDVVATDLENDPLSYAVEVLVVDPAAQLAYDLDQRLGLNAPPSYHQNARGLNEIYFQGTAGTWYYMLPDGSLYVWGGSLQSSSLVATLDASYYATPSKLDKAVVPAPVAGNPGVALSFAGNRLTINPAASYAGTFYVRTTVSDSSGSTSRTFQVNVTNAAPEIAPIADRTMSPSTNSIVVGLSASDADQDAVTYTATALGGDPMAQKAHELRQQLGLYYPGSDYTDARGLGEKYLQGTGGTWYYILPDGALYVWGGSLASSSLVAKFDSSYHANTAKLYQATVPTGGLLPGDVALALSGGQLTIDPRSGYTGAFYVRVTASDGLASTQQVFQVTVANAPPVVGSVADQSMKHNLPSITVSVPVSDADSDPVTLSAQAFAVDATAQLAFDLDQRLGLYHPGSDYRDARGLDEVYFQGAGGTWYYMLPDGSLYIWGGSVASSSLVAQLDASYNATPSKLYNAPTPTQQPIPSSLVNVTVVGNQVTVDPVATYVGDIQVRVTANDGYASVQKSFNVAVTNAAPTLSAPGDRTMPTTQDTLTVALVGGDADAETLSYSAQALGVEPLKQLAYDLDQRLGLYYPGSYSTNFRGLGEKYLQGTGGTWYFIVPSGELFIWGGSLDASSVVAKLDASFHTDPAKLHSAPTPVSTLAPGDVTLSISGNQLTVNPRAGYTGEFYVRVTATDGLASTSQTLKISVTPSGAALLVESMSDPQVTLPLSSPAALADALREDSLPLEPAVLQNLLDDVAAMLRDGQSLRNIPTVMTLGDMTAKYHDLSLRALVGRTPNPSVETASVNRRLLDRMHRSAARSIERIGDRQTRDEVGRADGSTTAVTLDVRESLFANLESDDNALWNLSDFLGEAAN